MRSLPFFILLLIIMMNNVSLPSSLGGEEAPASIFITSHEGFHWEPAEWLKGLPGKPIPPIEPEDIPHPEIRSILERLSSPDEEVRKAAVKELNNESYSGEFYHVTDVSTYLLATNMDVDPEDEYIIFVNPDISWGNPTLIIYDLREIPKGGDSTHLLVRQTIPFDKSRYYQWDLTVRDLTGDGAAEIIFLAHPQIGVSSGLEYLEILKGVKGKIRTIFFAVLDLYFVPGGFYHLKLSNRVEFQDAGEGLYDINVNAVFETMGAEPSREVEREESGLSGFKEFYRFEGEGSARYRWDPKVGSYITISDDRESLYDPAAPGESFEYEAQRRWAIDHYAFDPTWEREK